MTAENGDNQSAPDPSRLEPSLDRALWVGLAVLMVLAITLAGTRVFGSSAGIVAALAELAVAAILLLALRHRAHSLARQVADQQRMLSRQSIELEARAAAFEREAGRSRELADYLRSMNKELRDSVEALSHTRAERERALRDHAESTSSLDVVLESAPFGIALLDKELRFERVNAALTELDGAPIEAHMGHRLEDIIPDLAPMLVPVLAKVLDTDRPTLGIEFDSRSETARGPARQWTLNAYPVRAHDGSVRGVGVIVIPAK